ncbi:MAG: hypothetical protein NVS2B16_17690 [Chloroflexota bacterium]
MLPRLSEARTRPAVLAGTIAASLVLSQAVAAAPARHIHASPSPTVVLPRLADVARIYGPIFTASPIITVRNQDMAARARLLGLAPDTFARHGRATGAIVTFYARHLSGSTGTQLNPAGIKGVTGTIARYATDRGSRWDFRLTITRRPTPAGVTILRRATTRSVIVGDEAAVTEMLVTTSDSKGALHATDITFRRGPYLGAVSIVASHSLAQQGIVDLTLLMDRRIRR